MNNGMRIISYETELGINLSVLKMGHR